MYLTPERYRTMGYGADLSEVDDVELLSLLMAASALVDSYCAVPNLPQKHSFRGGVITDEKHLWRLGNDVGSEFGQRRFYPFHRPVQSVEQFHIIVTNSQYVAISPDDLVINEIGNWIEIVSLAVTSIGVFGSGLVPNIGLARPLAKVSYTYGFAFNVVGELLEATDGFTFRGQNQFWTADSVTIYQNGTDVTDDVTIDLEEGTATFDDQPLTSDIITADYSHPLPREIQFATGIIATTLLAERDLMAKGLGRIESLTVEEVSIRRSVAHRNQQALSVIPAEASLLLDGYVFRTVR